MMKAIEIAHLSKMYRIYSSPKDRLREAISPSGRRYHEEFYALSDVSFAIEKGQSVGIIGENGSGKSTLLKIICGVLQPTSGSVRTDGRIAALLELGATFNSDFSGRDNVYMNGALMGHSRSEIERRLPDIEAFADIGDFLDRPIKTYSSGMHVRLAFAAAVNINPDVLVVDEALAVGDMFFQHKCFSKMESYHAEGKTILLVHHDTSVIKNFCTAAILLHEGQLVGWGDPDEMTEQYVFLMRQKQTERAPTRLRVATKPDQALAGATLSFGCEAGNLIDVKILDIDGNETVTVQSGDTIIIEVRARVEANVVRPNIGVMLRDSRGNHIYGTNTSDARPQLEVDENGQICVYFALSPALAARSYSLSVWLSSETAHGEPFLLDKQVGVGVFEVVATDSPVMGIVDLCASVHSSFPELIQEPLLQRRARTYADVWDQYITGAFPEIQSATPYSRQELEDWRVLNVTDEAYEWPGDEWGDNETSARLFDEALTCVLDREASWLIELGAGAGRYTVHALERFPESTILSFDVSAECEKVLRKRCEAFVEAGRLRTYLLDDDPESVLRTVVQEDLAGSVDAVYSFDAMVHVDLHTLLVYWLSATRVLRLGGVLAMSVADSCNERAFRKLLHDAPGVYGLRGNAAEHFMWTSREAVDTILARLGFEITWLNGNGRDLWFAARLTDMDPSVAWLNQLGGTWRGV